MASYQRSQGKAGPRSSRQSRFATIPPVRVPRSAFDRSHGLKTNFNAGQLIPVMVDEILPGDTVTIRSSAFMRMATLLHPIMSNLYIDLHWWFAPARKLWDNWEKFAGGKESPDDTTEYVVPQLPNTWTEGSLGDYMGVPTKVPIGDAETNGYNPCSALPFRAYTWIWDEWYRDPSLQNPAPRERGDGPDPANYYPVLTRGKRKDYITGSLPWPQRGPGVNLPVGAAAPLVGFAEVDGSQILTGMGSVSPQFTTTATMPTDGPLRHNASGAGDVFGPASSSGADPGGDLAWFKANLAADLSAGSEGSPAPYADLSNAVGTSVNAFRLAFQTQKMYERDARGGPRYAEILISHFGTDAGDARLQRPEFLHSYTAPFNVNPIAQTSETGSSPQGNLSAQGQVIALADRGFTKSFSEHGFIMCLASVRAENEYQQQLERFWSRRTRFDYYWPSFAMIGEQEVKNREVYCDGTAEDADTWGYQERWAEYRYRQSRVTHLMRSNATLGGSLDTYHLAYHFTTRPTLGSAFIPEAPPVDRVVAVQLGPQFFGDFWFNVRHVRPMPAVGVPGLIDHF